MGDDESDLIHDTDWQIDVEGSEWDVLLGIEDRHWPHIRNVRCLAHNSIQHQRRLLSRCMMLIGGWIVSVPCCARADSSSPSPSSPHHCATASSASSRQRCACSSCLVRDDGMLDVLCRYGQMTCDCSDLGVGNLLQSYLNSTI